ncbi:4-hydroxyphenylpyruvate dioxygenase [Brevibacillus borstelensis]|uniref:4-hydroxyphenylpyruvate dioxygenase n=1 Tax=Brevibacillus borstelensis TaxID=45462 RepID=UPI0030BA63CE
MKNTLKNEWNVNVGVENFPIEDIDYLEIYAGNAKQAAFYYSKLFGLQVVGYSGLETGNRERSSYLLEKGDIRILISGAYSPESPIAEFVHTHGDGVKDIAFRVQNVEELYDLAIKRGATPVMQPYEISDDFGVVKMARVGTFGDVVHTLVERTGYDGFFLPSFTKIDEPANVSDTFLTRIDHLAIDVEKADQWTEYYENVFDFRMIQDFKKEDVSSSLSSLMLKAVQNGTERVKLPIVEPAAGERKSQVAEFLEYNRGAGVAHVALLTDDIIKAVENLQNNGFKFLSTPDAYYEALPERVGEIDEELAKLNELNILVDRDEEGYLLQIFGYPMTDRPTLFFEIIQRKGSRGFGNGNIRALFEAVEREQARRGNL